MRISFNGGAQTRIIFSRGCVATNVSSGTAIDLSTSEVYYYHTYAGEIILVNTSNMIRYRDRLHLPLGHW